MVPLPQHLLDAVLLDPSDDGARIVAADYWEEHGEVRGEFVRVQVELARRHIEPCAFTGWRTSPPAVCGLSVCPVCSTGIADLRHREWALLRGNETEPANYGENEWWWFYQHLPYHNLVIRRGFVESVSCSCADFLADGQAIFAREPVTEVRLMDKRPSRYVSSDLQSVRWGWWPSNDEHKTMRSNLWDLARGDFLSEPDALAGLSHAAVAWARSQAGLPLLPVGGHVPASV